LLDGLLAPRAGLHGVVVGHDAHRPAAHRPHAGDDAISGRVGLLVAREKKVLLELRAGIEQKLESLANEELAFFPELLPILDVPLLDTSALLKVPLFAHRKRPRAQGLAGFGLAQRMMISTPLP